LPTALANEDNKLSRPVTRLIALLALSAFINYIDRGNLSIAAPLLKGSLACRLAAWHLVVLLFLDLLSLPSGFRMAGGSL